MSSIRSQFRFFSQQPHLVYLDSAATALMPDSVCERILRYFQCEKVNVHRGGYRLANQITDEFEQVRQLCADFLHAADKEEIVFTSGVTEGINLLAHGLQSQLQAGDEILLTAAEHHANLVPWQQLAIKTGAVLKFVDVSPAGIDWDSLDTLLTPATKLVAFAHVSNTLGTIAPVADVIRRIRAHCNALVVVDGAQAVAHIPVDVTQMDCDFYLFSGHKLFGPTGIGVVYAKRKNWQALPVYQTGGEMVTRVERESAQFQDNALKFEAGTPNIAGVLGLGAALEWVSRNLNPALRDAELQLLAYLRQQLLAVPHIEVLQPTQPVVGLLMFRHQRYPVSDVMLLLDKQGICVRSGMHCAMPLHSALGSDGMLRVSLAPYNNRDDVDKFIAALEQANNWLASPNAQSDASALGESATEPHADLAALIQAHGWDNKYRQIMLLGKTLPRLDAAQCTEQTLVDGCDSQVWLQASYHDGVWRFAAESPAKMIRGLLAILLLPLQGKTSAQIQNFQLNQWLESLGIEQFLSQSRQNGITAIWRRITRLTAR